MIRRVLVVEHRQTKSRFGRAAASHPGFRRAAIRLRISLSAVEEASCAQERLLRLDEKVARASWKIQTVGRPSEIGAAALLDCPPGLMG